MIPSARRAAQESGHQGADHHGADHHPALPPTPPPPLAPPRTGDQDPREVMGLIYALSYQAWALLLQARSLAVDLPMTVALPVVEALDCHIRHSSALGRYLASELVGLEDRS